MTRDEDFIEIILSRRSIRQFKQERIPKADLKRCLDTARLAPSASNLQPIEYFLVDDELKINEIFPLLKWAGYITPDGDPKKGNEPTAYLFILVNRSIREDSAEYDVGAAAENFMLSAWSIGIGSCWLISVDRQRVREILKIPEGYVIDSVVALGYPDEQPVIESTKDDIRYWKDDADNLHVPKRDLADILHLNKW